ncbi:MAG: hypothetical protein KC561_11300, partial [Myxococcales bacterium]|nr:hypothetical protein [Myxococcales bacterium]
PAAADAADDTQVTNDQSGDTNTADQGQDGSNSGPLCRSCLTAGDCGGNGANLCLELPSGENVCGVDCLDQPEICPEGFFCATLQEGIAQCAPETLYCQSQCDEPCENPGDFCDPISGECGPQPELCDECQINEQCGGDGSICLTFPDIDSSRGCVTPCSGNEPCPDGYACLAVNEEGTLRMCVPEALTCVDRCAEVDCVDGAICDPLTGQCETPLGFCDPCVSSTLCGGEGDLCLGLIDGNAHCTLDCSQGQECPSGSFCAGLTNGGSQCVPFNLVCIDKCVEPEEVVCPSGQNCDPVDGECKESTLTLCQAPCEDNFACGAQNDICVGFEGQLNSAFCAQECGENAPCPFGYSCALLSDGVTRQCSPTDFDLGCGACTDVSCPEGEACRPSDGECVAVPQACTTSEECGAGEVCDIFENRCVPSGLSCESFSDCGSSAECTSPSVGVTGECEPLCSAFPGGCPEQASHCASFYNLLSICVDEGLGRPESCGRFVEWGQIIGEPCPASETFDGCSSGTPVCLTDVVDGIPGFCTLECGSDEDCGEGAVCDRLPGQAVSHCVPYVCDCMRTPDLDIGEIDVVKRALDQAGISRCDLGFVMSERRAAGPLVANNPFVLELAAEVRNDPLLGVDLVRNRLETVGGASLPDQIRKLADDLGVETTISDVDFDAASFCLAVQGFYEVDDPDRPGCPALTAIEEELPEWLVPDLVQVLSVVQWAAKERDAALPDGAAAERAESLLALYLDGVGDGVDSDGLATILDEYKLNVLFEAGATSARFIGEAEFSRTGTEPFEGEEVIETGLGAIVIAGDDDHIYCRVESECEAYDLDDVERRPVVVDEHIAFLLDT